MRITLVLILGFLLSACGSKSIDETADWSVEQLYQSAKHSLSTEQYLDAIKKYESLESRFPFDHHATQAQLDVAYAYYKLREPVSAVAAVERFIKLNPRHPNVDYAYYLRGLIHFNQGNDALSKLYDRQLSDYDRNLIHTAYDDFLLLLRRFPQSSYAADARQRLIALREELAQSNLAAARYYATRGAWVAVVNRVQHILRNYQSTSVMRAALNIQLQAYEHLGLDELSLNTRRMIALNYPGN